jgi:hypothetical protein
MDRILRCRVQVSSNLARNKLFSRCSKLTSSSVSNSDNDLVLGLPLELYPNPAEKSELCGQSVVVKNTATGQEITAVVSDASQRDAYTTFTKGAYQALGGDLDVGELSVSYHFADADSISSSLPSAFSTSATGSKEKSVVKTSTAQQAPQTPAAASSSSKAYSKSADTVQAAAAVAPKEQTTTQAPTTTTSAAPQYDSASAASASSKAAADAAWACKCSKTRFSCDSKLTNFSYPASSSAEAAKLWASSSSAQAAAASESAKAKAEADAAWAGESKPSNFLDFPLLTSRSFLASSSASAAAAASSKAAADAAWAESSSKAAAAGKRRFVPRADSCHFPRKQS